MFQLVYASTSTRPFDEGELHTLVEHARRRNEERGITSVLVHRNGSFLHVIEGTEDDVRALYERICEDDRHRWITLLKASPTEERDFPDAPLAFRDRSMVGARQPLTAGNGTNDAGALASGRGAAHETLIHFQRANGKHEGPPEQVAPASGSASEAAAS